MAIDPNIFYRAGALKGQLARQAKQDRQQSFSRAMSGISSVTKMIGAKQDEYDQNMSDFNGEIPRDIVPEETMMQLTRHIAQEKAVYTANAKTMRSSFSRKKKREAAEENEKIKSGLAKVYADYQTAFDLGKVQEKNLANVDQKYGDQLARDNSLNFANQKWYENGIKFSRDGMTINDVKEEQVLDDSGNPLPQSKLVPVDKRLSDFKFAKPVQGIGEDTFSNASLAIRSAGEKHGNAGVKPNQDFLRIEKNKYVKAMKSLSPEEQRYFYFNGMSGEPGTAQADIDAMKQIGISKAEYDAMMEIQDENAPGYQEAMNKKEQFEKVKQTLGFRKDFLTPQMIESQWNTLTDVYNSGYTEYARLRDERLERSAKKNAKEEKSWYETLNMTEKNEYATAKTILDFSNSQNYSGLQGRKTASGKSAFFKRGKDGNMRLYYNSADPENPIQGDRNNPITLPNDAETRYRLINSFFGTQDRFVNMFTQKAKNMGTSTGTIFTDPNLSSEDKNINPTGSKSNLSRDEQLGLDPQANIKNRENSEESNKEKGALDDF